MNINKISEISSSFMGQQTNQMVKTNESKSSFMDDKKILWSLLTLAGIGCASFVFMNRSGALEKALKKEGVVIKNKVAVLKDSGEKYTGSVSFWNKKLKTQNRYENGFITESLATDINGKEVSAKFYKKGQLYLEVRRNKKAGDVVAGNTVVFVLENKNVSICDVNLKDSQSMFEWGRDLLKNDAVKNLNAKPLKFNIIK